MIALLLAALTLMTGAAWAGLGESESSIHAHRPRAGARRHVDQRPGYTVHELVQADGSRQRQYVNAQGQVFAVSWTARAKPQLAEILGTSYPAYATAAGEAAQRSGLQRQFRHEGLDLVVHSGSHLQVYSGYAYRRSLMPAGLNPQRWAQEVMP